MILLLAEARVLFYGCQDVMVFSRRRRAADGFYYSAAMEVFDRSGKNGSEISGITRKRRFNLIIHRLLIFHEIQHYNLGILGFHYRTYH